VTPLTLINPRGPEKLTIFSDIFAASQPRETIAIVGSSGSGKNHAALILLGGLDRPSTGVSKIFAGQEIYKLSEAARHAFRNKHLGLLYQVSPFACPEFSAP